MTRDLDEDLIEATIRRVAASKAARLPDAVADGPPDETDAAPDLHLVAPADDDAHEAPMTQRPPADESLIEATLRRIEAQQAARAADREGGEAAIAGAAFERQPAPDLHLVEVAPEPEVRSGTATDAGSGSDAAGLRRDLDDVRRQLRELTARVDAMVASQPDQPRRSGRQARTPEAAVAPSSGAPDEDWDDSPRIARIDVGLPPRPAIVRDAPPVEPAEGPVAPGVLPPQRDQASPKRAFDLLPRTYRITVEDKRRGVDLVPLHRALLGMDGVRDMSLLSYSNGTAIVALEATAEIAPDALGAAVSRAMAREVKVEVHNEQTMVVKLDED